MGVLKNVNPLGVAKTPAAYKIVEVTITNAEGEAINVETMLKELEITESIYSPTLVCKISVLDEANLLETLPLFGLETIYVKLSRIEGSTDDKQGVTRAGDEHFIEHVFYVTEFPLFGRPRRERVQVWSMAGVSHHGWKNPLMRISRGYLGPFADEIVKIADDAFGAEVEVRGSPYSKGRGVINIQTPLQAMEWFRRRTFEENGTPFYLYEIMDDDPAPVLYLESHSSIAKKEIHRRFYDSRDFNVDVATLEDYEARIARMVEVSSMLKLSKIVPGRDGAFASENNFVDLSKKKFFKRYYSYNDEMFPLSSTINETNILESPPFYEFPDIGHEHTSTPKYIRENEENLNEEFFAHLEFMSLNSEAYYESELQNYMQISHEQIDVLNAFPGIFNTLMHDVRVHGDFELNAGKTVELMFPKAVDPAQTTQIGTLPTDLFDEHLSGKYIVISAIHHFKDQEYYTTIRTKRDSFSP